MTETREGIRQSDFAEKHGLLPGEVKDLRDKHLREGDDYWSVVRAIWWTHEAAEKIEKEMMISPPPTLARKLRGIITREQQDETIPDAVDLGKLPEVETPENFSAFVLKPCRNNRYVYAAFNGEQIAVAIHPRNQKKIIRKSIRVRAERDGETTKYFHVP